MSSYDKLIKSATKPKAVPPKPKYIDPIIAATFAKDGSLQDMCRSLVARLADRDGIVVFKSLIVLHTMIRNGGIDNVLSHLASSGGTGDGGSASVRLRNVGKQNWHGETPPTLSSYSTYLDDRIRAYRELKHDVIRSSENYNSSSSGGGASRVGDGRGEHANRLRRLTVEKGLLREIGITQKVGNAVLKCSFFHDDLGDELTLTAFRMTLKDLLALYTAVNEGIINMLEHYFEMSKPDATRSLELYRRFVRQTETVVAYLSAARRAASSININIPNLKHAPTSLAGALEEYLNDENFEENRITYKENRRVAEGGTPAPKKEEKKEAPKETPKPSASTSAAASTSTSTAPPPGSNPQALQDFFASIENEQENMFNPNGHGAQIPGSSSFGGGLFQQPGGGGMMMPQATGMGMPQMGMNGGIQPQMTGYNPFLQQQQQMMMQPQQTGFGGMQPQQTGFLQPQATGFNPFRQSMMMPQGTGMGMGMGMNGFQQPQQQQFTPQQVAQSQPQNPVSPQSTIQQQQQQQQQSPSTIQSQPHSRPTLGSLGSISEDVTSNGQPNAGNLNAFNSAFSTGGSTMPLSPSASNSGPTSPPASSSSTITKPITAQKTGFRNPFAPPPGSTPPPSPPPAGPKGPSLNQLAMSAFGNNQMNGGGAYGLGASAWDPNQQQQQQQSQSPQQTGLQPQKTGLIGSVASEFAFSKPTSQTNGTTSPAPTQSTLPTATGSTNGFSSAFSNLSLGGGNSNGLGGLGSTNTGTTNSSNTNGIGNTTNPFPSSNSFNPQQQQQPIQPQATGFGGSSILPFKPESSFGASLAANQNQNPSSTLLTPSRSQSTLISHQSTGNNPFGASFNSQQNLNNQQQQNQTNGLSPQPAGFQSNVKPFQPTSSFGQQQVQQQQTGQFGSLF